MDLLSNLPSIYKTIFDIGLKYAMMSEQNELNKRVIIQTAVTWLMIFTCVFAAFSLHTVYINSTSPEFSSDLENFQSDFPALKDKALSRRLINKKNKFAAYGTYLHVPKGVYQAVFYFQGDAAQSSELALQIAADKGKSILASISVGLDTFPRSKKIQFEVEEEKEIEPRVLYRSGSRDVQVTQIMVEKTGNIFPWIKILYQAAVLSILLALVFLSVLYASRGNRRWTVFLAAVFFILGCFMILRKAWVSEDAFITLRYVENFLDGLGPVFNAGERVEGYTHPLWFAVVSFFRWLGLSAKGSVILPGLAASFSALYILFFRIRFAGEPDSGTQLNLGAVVLVGTSSFIDFGTSGLETPLSYLLLVIYATFIAENRWKTQPAAMGLLLALLVLTRPDFGLFLILIVCLYLYGLIRRRIALKKVFALAAFPLFLLGGWQIFRMGYYAALFPNPVYAKTGAGTYFSQGIKYILDLFQGSLLWIVLILSIAALLTQIRNPGFKSRALILFSGLLHGFFVIRGGGDFMHGRYLLPAFILLAASMAGAFDRFIRMKAVHKYAYIALTLLLFYFSYQTKPVQYKDRFYNDGISNERLAYYQQDIVPLKHLFTDTVIFMWKTIGRNYRSLAHSAETDIRIAYKNVGYIGYYAGKRVSVMDKLGLTDPVTARVELLRRERPGHEKRAPFAYLMLRGITFADTPFEVWNDAASTRYGILWDLRPDRLQQFDFMLPDDFKNRIDSRIREYLNAVEKKPDSSRADFLFFLKHIWLPHASAQDRDLFIRVYPEDGIAASSSSYQWIQKNRTKMDILLSHIRGPLTARQFAGNVIFALSRSLHIRFDDQRGITP